MAGHPPNEIVDRRGWNSGGRERERAEGGRRVGRRNETKEEIRKIASLFSPPLLSFFIFLSHPLPPVCPAAGLAIVAGPPPARNGGA